MTLVAAKCTQCGANLQVDPNSETTVCDYCNTAFITERAIKHYHNYNVAGDYVNTQVVNNYNVQSKRRGKVAFKTTSQEIGWIGRYIIKNKNGDVLAKLKANQSFETGFDGDTFFSVECTTTIKREPKKVDVLAGEVYAFTVGLKGLLFNEVRIEEGVVY